MTNCHTVTNVKYTKSKSSKFLFLLLAPTYNNLHYAESRGAQGADNQTLTETPMKPSRGTEGVPLPSARGSGGVS